MTEKIIQDKLYRHFMNYEYKLFNTFLFDWECDFFCVSKNGYQNEIEIKVTRSDFFADFKKKKHKIFVHRLAGKTHICVEGGIGRGDIICEVPARVITIRGARKFDMPDILSGKQTIVDWDRKIGKYIVNDWNDRMNINIMPRTDQYRAPVTPIRFENILQKKIPHRFWYAVPEGLIKPNEVPEYAGIIYISDTVKEIRRAPYMHKNNQDITKELLNKYYNLWNYKLSLDQKILLNTKAFKYGDNQEV